MEQAMALISIKDVRLHFGGEHIFDGIELHVQKKDTVCLLGRNGQGKSSLLRLIAGQLLPDSGSVAIENNARVALLQQHAPASFGGSALDFCTTQAEPACREVPARKFLSQLGISPEAELSQLSGGQRRRVMLAAALAAEADILLLDEPTNHLDITSLIWLEQHLSQLSCAIIFISHDRAFARSLATRTAELDRGRLFLFDCGLDDFFQRREAQLEQEEQQRAAFDKKLAAEEAWLRRGIKARRTRNEGRVKALLAMRDQYRQRRSRQGSANLRALDAGSSGKLVADIKDLSFSWGDQPIVNQLTTSIQRGDRIGIVGPNGAGKTTLLRLLLGDLKADSGSVRLGTQLHPIYYDQLRQQLDPEKTVIENLSGGDDTLLVGDSQVHVNAYLQDFLFSPDRARSPVKILSGGERARLLLAKLFAQPSNLLALDEPTNDLDMETLDLLGRNADELQRHRTAHQPRPRLFGQHRIKLFCIHPGRQASGTRRWLLRLGAAARGKNRIRQHIHQPIRRQKAGTAQAHNQLPRAARAGCPTRHNQSTGNRNRRNQHAPFRPGTV
jgi:ATP-binding cassette subfamily F protein uup